MRKPILVLGLIANAILVSGCSVLQQNNEDFARMYLPQVGQTLTLQVAVPYPHGQARVFLQQQLEPIATIQDSGVLKFASGAALSGRGVNEYEPYCELEVGTVSDGHYRLMPDVFGITRVEQTVSDMNVVGLDSPRPVYLAQSVDDGGLSQITYITDIWLNSVAQPEIYKMSCRQVMDPPDGTWVSLAEMQAATADILRFNPL